jgi:hypothetical protein
MTRKIEPGAVIRRVFQIYVEQSPILMPAAAVVFVLTGGISAVLVRANAGLQLLAVLIGFVASMLFTGMVVELVRGNGWQVFWVLVVLEILVIVLVAVIDQLAASIGAGLGIVVSVVAGVLTAPFAALAAAVLYFELRDEPATATAGVPADADPGPGGEL